MKQPQCSSDSRRVVWRHYPWLDTTGGVLTIPSKGILLASGVHSVTVRIVTHYLTGHQKLCEGPDHIQEVSANPLTG